MKGTVEKRVNVMASRHMKETLLVNLCLGREAAIPNEWAAAVL
jgi:hypothetical protein